MDDAKVYKDIENASIDQINFPPAHVFSIFGDDEFVVQEWGFDKVGEEPKENLVHLDMFHQQNLTNFRKSFVDEEIVEK